jgi:uncharacterized membrane protein
MQAYREGHFRSVVKAVSYRTLATIATTVIVFVFTRRLALSIGVGLVEAIAKIACYYLHERLWSYIKIGRREHPLSSLPVRRALDQEDLETVKSTLRDLGYIGED